MKFLFLFVALAIAVPAGAKGKEVEQIADVIWTIIEVADVWCVLYLVATRNGMHRGALEI